MHEVLADLHPLTSTPWKIIGLRARCSSPRAGSSMFYATRKNKKVTVADVLFWYLSVSGSVLTPAYFIWGKNDSVGIIQDGFFDDRAVLQRVRAFEAS